MEVGIGFNGLLLYGLVLEHRFWCFQVWGLIGIIGATGCRPRVLACRFTGHMFVSDVVVISVAFVGICRLLQGFCG